MFLRNTVKSFIELCLIVNSYKKWVLTAICAQTQIKKFFLCGGWAPVEKYGCVAWQHFQKTSCDSFAR
jgi:hypothetical protein